MGLYTKRSTGVWVPITGVHTKRSGGYWAPVNNIYTKRSTGVWVNLWSGGTAPQATDTFDALSSGSWRDTYGWRTDNDDVYQGEWGGYGNHKGLFYYDYSTIQGVLAGRTIDSFRIYLHRISSGGYSSAQTVYAWLHNYASEPAGEPALAGGPTNIGSLAWGDSKWLTLPNSWAEHLRDGNYRGIAFYHSSGSPYVIMDGRSANSSYGRLEITHS